MKKTTLLNATAFAPLNPPSEAMRNTMVTNIPPALYAALEDFIEPDVMLARDPDMNTMVDYWDQTDAIVEGYKAVKDAGVKYLPKFANEEQEKYEMRLGLTKFTNVYRDIVEGLSTKPFEEEISLIQPKTGETAIPNEYSEFLEDVDGSGNNATVFASLTFFNGINSAIDWIFVDYPKVDPEVIKTQADLKSAGIKPFWSHVLGRNVLAARAKVIGGEETLYYVKILEPGTPDHVRIFERDDAGKIRWSLYVKTDQFDPNKKTYFVLEDAGYLSISLIPLVPFITGRRNGRTFQIYPAMRDAADLQIELYQQESALKFIKTLAGYPMLAANGLRPQLEADGKTPKPVKVGPMVVLWGLPDNNGNHGEWTFVEPAATSMTFLSGDVKDTINQLRELGRQPLTAQSGNLTVITTAVAAGKSKSAVGAWALILKNCLEKCLLITGMFAKWPEYKPQVNVFNEFDEYNDDGKDLDTLNTARTNRDISQRTYWNELKRRKVLSPEFDADAEETAILNEVPTDDQNLEDDQPKPKPKLVA